MVSLSGESELSFSENGYSKPSLQATSSEEITFDLKDWTLKKNFSTMGQSKSILRFDYALVSVYNANDIIPLSLLNGSKTERMDQIVLLYLRAKDMQANRKYALWNMSVTPYENFLSGIFSVPIVKSIVLRDEDSLLRITSEGVSEIKAVAVPKASLRLENVDAPFALNGADERKHNMSKRRRDHTRIIHDILFLANANNEIGITKIIYKCNLNYRSALRAVNELLESRLLEIGSSNGAKQKYTITPEGITLLEDLKKFNFIKA